jgi:hypothetical protein
MALVEKSMAVVRRGDAANPPAKEVESKQECVNIHEVHRDLEIRGSGNVDVYGSSKEGISELRKEYSRSDPTRISR